MRNKIAMCLAVGGLLALTAERGKTESAVLSGLSQDQMVQGLKDALAKGLQQAIAGLGHNDGFLTNLSPKIPMPEKLQTVEKALRAMKQEKLADARLEQEPGDDQIRVGPAAGQSQLLAERSGGECQSASQSARLS